MTMRSQKNVNFYGFKSTLFFAFCKFSIFYWPNHYLPLMAQGYHRIENPTILKKKTLTKTGLPLIL